MRMRVEWDADIPLSLPFSYHQLLQGVIYENLRGEDSFSSRIHDNGYRWGNRKYPLFCYSELMGPYRRSSNRIIFYGRVAFEVSSPDPFLINRLKDRIHENGLRFGTTCYEQVDIFLSDDEIEESRILLKTVSPITIRRTGSDTGESVYYSPFDEEFYKLLWENIQRRYYAYTGVPIRSPIQIQLVDENSVRRCVTRYKNTPIEAYHGTFLLEGERRYLNFIYQAGLGAKNSQGFGLMEVQEW